jgi:hypothetical protein
MIPFPFWYRPSHSLDFSRPATAVPGAGKAAANPVLKRDLARDKICLVISDPSGGIRVLNFNLYPAGTRFQTNYPIVISLDREHAPFVSGRLRVETGTGGRPHLGNSIENT